MMEDLFTIALPVYKRTDFIRSALDSAVKQKVKCRVLLIDNNSPHNDFKDIVESYDNPLIKYVRTESTVPQDENFNNCFRYAETPWVTILHDDDMLHFQYSELAERLINRFGNRMGGFVVESHVSEKEWDTGYTELSFTDDIKVVKEPYFYFAQLSPFPGVCLHRETALKAGGFKKDLHPIADYDFWYRYCTTVPMLYVRQKMAWYRISPQQSTNHLIDNMINHVYSYRQNIIKKGGLDNYLTRLSLEYTRINNIRFFRQTYPDLKITENYINPESLARARKILKNKFISRVVRAYIEKMSFGDVNRLKQNVV